MRGASITSMSSASTWPATEKSLRKAWSSPDDGGIRNNRACPKQPDEPACLSPVGFNDMPLARTTTAAAFYGKTALIRATSGHPGFELASKLRRHVVVSRLNLRKNMNYNGPRGANLSGQPAQVGDPSMDRRTFLKSVAAAGSLATTGRLSAPALAQGAAARTLRFVPQANLANFDPIWGTQYVV